ncbi:MAG: hypothetical protein GX443_02625 [Deltaproteobacteria bacterium]|nr:hypothetical protein [Deltaproteobacteria bacterium]
MKLPTLSAADLRKNRTAMIAGGATFVCLLLLHLLWVRPLLTEKEELEAKVKQERELVQKYHEKLNQAQSIKDNLTKQEVELRELQKKLFRGSDAYQLAASLGDLLSSKDDPKSKLDIKTYQVLASKEYGLYQEVTLRYNFMTSVEGLHFFLERLRNLEMAILVQEINVQKIQRKGGPDLVVNVIVAALLEKTEKT